MNAMSTTAFFRCSKRCGEGESRKPSAYPQALSPRSSNSSNDPNKYYLEH